VSPISLLLSLYDLAVTPQMEKRGEYLANIRNWTKFMMLRPYPNLHYQGKSTPFVKICQSKLSGSNSPKAIWEGT